MGNRVDKIDVKERKNALEVAGCTRIRLERGHAACRVPLKDQARVP